MVVVREVLRAAAGRGAAILVSSHHLPCFGTLLGVVVVTQLVTAVGVGGWFPRAAPGLRSGLGGPVAGAQVTAAQLAVPLAAGAVGMSLCALWWRRCEVV